MYRSIVKVSAENVISFCSFFSITIANAQHIEDQSVFYNTSEILHFDLHPETLTQDRSLTINTKEGCTCSKVHVTYSGKSLAYTIFFEVLKSLLIQNFFRFYFFHFTAPVSALLFIYDPPNEHERSSATALAMLHGYHKCRLVWNAQIRAEPLYKREKGKFLRSIAVTNAVL